MPPLLGGACPRSSFRMCACSSLDSVASVFRRRFAELQDRGWVDLHACRAMVWYCVGNPAAATALETAVVRAHRDPISHTDTMKSSTPRRRAGPGSASGVEAGPTDWAILHDAWVAAREPEKAVEALVTARKRSDNMLVDEVDGTAARTLDMFHQGVAPLVASETQSRRDKWAEQYFASLQDSEIAGGVHYALMLQQVGVCACYITVL
jgi:hypothetical protein